MTRCSGGSWGEARGARSPSPIFKPNRGPKGAKQNFLTPPPFPLLPYLKVLILYCILLKKKGVENIQMTNPLIEKEENIDLHFNLASPHRTHQLWRGI